MPVLDETSRQLLQYHKLRKQPKSAHIWNTSYANEIGGLCQGIGQGPKVPKHQHAEGTNTFCLIKFVDTPQDRLNEICHSMVVCKVKPHKEDPNCMHITVTGVVKEHAIHLLQTLEKNYEITTDWEGTKFAGIDLAWGYNA